MSESCNNSCALPSKELCRQQAAWLRGARSRLLRRAGLANRRKILEIGAGWGFVAQELNSRCDGEVIALDLEFPESIDGIEQVVGDAQHLPFADASFDLLFSQLSLLWVKQPTLAIAEAFRVLQPGGMFVAIEPDYGGMMEMPLESALKDVWISALTRAGADPLIGRKLPALFQDAGFRVETRFLDRLEETEAANFEFLTELPLVSEELAAVNARRKTAAQATTHLPLWMIVAEVT